MNRALQAIADAMGHVRGFGSCYRCGHSWAWRQPHGTQFGSGGRACFPLCEECWEQLTPEQRLPYYQQLVDSWIRDAPEQLADYQLQRALIEQAVLQGG